LSDSQPQLSAVAEKVLNNPFLTAVHTNPHVADALQSMIELIREDSLIQGMADYFIDVAKGNRGLSVVDLKNISSTGSNDAKFSSAFVVATQTGKFRDARRLITVFIQRNSELSLDAIDLFETIRQSAERRSQPSEVIAAERNQIAEVVDDVSGTVTKPARLDETLGYETHAKRPTSKPVLTPDVNPVDAQTEEAVQEENRPPRSDATQVFRTDQYIESLSAVHGLIAPEQPQPGADEPVGALDPPFKTDLLPSIPPSPPVSVKVFAKPDEAEPAITIPQPAVTVRPGLRRSEVRVSLIPDAELSEEDRKEKAHKNTYSALRDVIHARGDSPYESVENLGEILNVSSESNFSQAVTELHKKYGESEVPEGFEHFKLVVRTNKGDFCLAMGIGKDRGTCRILKYYGDVPSGK